MEKQAIHVEGCRRTADSDEGTVCYFRKGSSTSIRSILVAFTLACFIPTSLSGQAIFRGLGDLPGGVFYSEACDVSADGAIVVGLSVSASGTEAFRCSAAGILPDDGLGDLPGGDFYSRARGVSGDGSIVVGESFYAAYEGGGINQAFRWVDLNGNGQTDPEERLENNEESPMGFLPGGVYNETFALGISSDGSTIVGNSWSTFGQEGFRSTGTVIQEGDGIGDLPGGDFHSSANGASQDGSVVVGRGCSTGGFFLGHRWTAGGMQDLGVLPGAHAQSSKALGVSADGLVVVGGSAGPTEGSYEAFRWQDGVMTGLGDLPGGRHWSLANAVSADGTIVVGYAENDTGYRAFIWDTENGIENLRNVLEEDYDLDLTGWTLTNATAISADGLTIVGYGGNPDGNIEAWIAVLIPNAPPVADAGDDQTIQCACQIGGTQVALNGSGSHDPEGHPLTYTWTGPFEGSPVVGPDPAVIVTLTPGCVGEYTVSLTVNDDVRDSAPDGVQIRVVDTTPPNIVCPASIEVEAQDPEGVPVADPAIQAFLNGALADDNCDPAPVINHDAPIDYFPVGQTTVPFTATDSSSNTSPPCEATVTVQDSTPPQIFISEPQPDGHYPSGDLVLDFSAYDLVSGWLQPPALAGTLTDEAGFVVPVEPGDIPGAGVYTLVVAATDEAGNTAESGPVPFVVYDPQGGFASGGGWISSPAGAYVLDPAVSGRANFNFICRYNGVATAPTGQTDFRFRLADLRFRSSSYDWLVVTGGDYARFQGTGTINGTGDYLFMIWAGDTPDTFRLRIWQQDAAGNEIDVYDNGVDQAIGGGSIRIHAQ